MDPSETNEGEVQHDAVTEPASDLRRVGRYLVERVIGRGGFGTVYLARDEQLARLVAIKIAHPEMIANPERRDAYLDEARIVARLDHPNIVPVHDVGSTPEVPFYSVSKYVPGTDLSEKLRQYRFHPLEAAELIAVIADALHYAHKQGLVHRDVKPGNILIDQQGTPFLVDFGLALREDSLDSAPRYVGTPTYTSPEQARGEGHRVDGRSDIFSLGIVFYELLTGKRPFKGSSQEELLRQVASYEPRPPRQYNELIPAEAERICQRAMEKLACDRYMSAHDMASDLRHLLSQQAITPIPSGTTRPATDAPPVSTTSMPPTDSAKDFSLDEPPASSGRREIRIVPKGIRSFDSHDADFFLQLLPGARDRDGLPDLIRFWKTRIEDFDADRTFPVGLIYGPSGCGKSSMVKAGLLPHLSANVIAVAVEAAPERTENRLLRALRKHCPTLPQEQSLVETVKMLRMGYGPPQSHKVLILIDQFEQWLHAHSPTAEAELVQTLRQCDGARVQCILMVRDDFWMAITHFMRALEIRISEGQNSAAVDMFPLRHASKVLDAFGRAFGTLPPESEPVSSEQKDFLTRAIADLSENDKVICVRLSLFAEIMKSKPWTGETLRKIGGVKGVGRAYLEETFSASTAPPENRFHQAAARRVLRALLPASGTNIRGHMRAEEELREASGYESRTRDFEELIEILDSELRLITPADPEGASSVDDGTPSPTGSPKSQRYYQLTHDYLVHSLRDWLTQKQRETQRGRAELLLAERASLWNDKPENRYLPTLTENVRIQLLTDRGQRTVAESAMLRRANWVHGVRTAIWLGLLVLLGVGALAVRDRMRAQQVVQALASCDIRDVQRHVADLQSLRLWSDPVLRDRLGDPAVADNEQLRYSLALLPVDPLQNEYLVDRLPQVDAEAFPEVLHAIDPSQTALESLWRVATDEQAERGHRFQAACALAQLASEDSRWVDVAAFVVDHLVHSVDSPHLPDRIQQLAPARLPLVPHLLDVVAGPQDETDPARQPASAALSEFLRRETSHPSLIDLLIRKTPTGLAAKQRDPSLRRRGLAGALLLHLGELEPVIPYLRPSHDPSLRSFITHFGQLFPLDHDRVIPAAIACEDDEILRPIVQSLGYVDPTLLAAPRSEELTQWLRELYATNSDAGLHSMCGWALDQWGQRPEPQPTALQTGRWRSVVNAAKAKQAEWERRLTAQRPKDLTEDPNLLVRLPLEPGDVKSGKLKAPDMDWCPGIVGQAIRVSETTGKVVNCGAIGGIQVDQPASYGCWYLSEDQDQYGALFSKMDTGDGNRGFDVWLEAGRIASHLVHVEDTTNQVFDMVKSVSQARPSAGQWHHVMITYDGTKKLSAFKIFIDGKLAPAISTSNTEPHKNSLTDSIETQAPLMLGARYVRPGDKAGYKTGFEGWLDDVRIYDRALTAAEIADIHTAGVAAMAKIEPEKRDSAQQAILNVAMEAANVVDPRAFDKWHHQRQWYVNAAQQLVVVIPNDPKRSRSVGYDLAVSACEVSVADFRRFRPNFNRWDRETANFDPHCPVQRVTWYDAAAYCNWLSKLDGILEPEWCYVPNEDGEYAAGMSIRADFLQRTGYRLPTPPEWSLACRGGTDSDYFFGVARELCNNYAWHLGNANGFMHAVGTKLPNDFGIFDSHGNAWEWSLGDFSVVKLGPVDDESSRSLFGGALNSTRSNIRSGANTSDIANGDSNYNGFRVVRRIR